MSVIESVCFFKWLVASALRDNRGIWILSTKMSGKVSMIHGIRKHFYCYDRKYILWKELKRIIPCINCICTLIWEWNELSYISSQTSHYYYYYRSLMYLLVSFSFHVSLFSSFLILFSFYLFFFFLSFFFWRLRFRRSLASTFYEMTL